MRHLALTTILLVLGLAAPASAKPEDHGNERASQRALELIGWMGSRSDSIHVWLREARARKDAERARCLDAFLSESHAAERLAIDLNTELQQAAAAGEDFRMGTLMDQLRILSDRSRRLYHTAGACGRPFPKRSGATR